MVLAGELFDVQFTIVADERAGIVKTVLFRVAGCGETFAYGFLIVSIPKSSPMPSASKPKVMPRVFSVKVFKIAPVVRYKLFAGLAMFPERIEIEVFDIVVVFKGIAALIVCVVRFRPKHCLEVMAGKLVNVLWVWFAHALFIFRRLSPVN